MNKADSSLIMVLLFIFSGLFLSDLALSGQDTTKLSPPLPDNINKIVTVSCMPCHTSEGGLLSRGKLNFTEWTQYSLSKQKEKADNMYSEIKKEKMPPKSARETRPDIIPTKDQTDIIKKWAESLSPDDK
jgi:hypothetical protein